MTEDLKRWFFTVGNSNLGFLYGTSERDAFERFVKSHYFEYSEICALMDAYDDEDHGTYWVNHHLEGDLDDDDLDYELSDQTLREIRSSMDHKIKNSKKFSDATMRDLRGTLTKMIAHLDTDPSIQTSFSCLWVLQRETVQRYIYNDDLDLDDCMDLYYAYKKSQQFVSSEEAKDLVFKQIINKIIKKFEQMFEEGYNKTEIKYLIKIKLPDLTDNITADQLEALIGMIEACNRDGD